MRGRRADTAATAVDATHKRNLVATLVEAATGVAHLAITVATVADHRRLEFVTSVRVPLEVRVVDGIQPTVIGNAIATETESGRDVVTAVDVGTPTVRLTAIRMRRHLVSSSPSHRCRISKATTSLR